MGEPTVTNELTEKEIEEIYTFWRGVLPGRNLTIEEYGEMEKQQGTTMYLDDDIHEWLRMKKKNSGTNMYTIVNDELRKVMNKEIRLKSNEDVK